jgi:aldehyde dehydrogenase
MTVYAAPGAAGAKIAYKPQYNNFIGGSVVDAVGVPL